MNNNSSNGISMFFYFAIPAVLAVAAIWWLAFGEGLHYFERELSQEKRHAEIVGASPLPKESLKLETHVSRECPLVIDRAEIDGSELYVYIHNAGSANIEYAKLFANLLAPDGTVVASGGGYIAISFNGPEIMRPGMKAELRGSIPTDPRGVILRLEMIGDH